MDGRWKGRAGIEGEQVACVEIPKKGVEYWDEVQLNAQQIR